MNCKALVLIAAMAVGSPLAAGQEQPFKWWFNDRFKKELHLTAEQSTAIERIYQASLPDRTASKEKLDAFEATLSKMIDDDHVTQAQVMEQATRVEALRSQRNTTRTLMLYHMLKVLAPEQREQMNALHDQWVREHPRSGRLE